MKRLTLLYQPDQDEKYPWLLKHPKIEAGLAKFQTRADAIDWFLSEPDEVYIWFQNDKAIFGGQLAVIEQENVKEGTEKKLLTIPNISKFDGGESYDAICKEFSIHPSYLSREPFKAALAKRVPTIDFVLISDRATYFPKELEMKKKSQSSYVDLNSIKASLELKIQELQNEKLASEETIKGLQDQLENKKFDFMKVNEEIDALKNQNQEEVNGLKEELDKTKEQAAEQIAAAKEEATQQAAAINAEQPVPPMEDQPQQPAPEGYYGPEQQAYDPNTQQAYDPYGNPIVPYQQGGQLAMYGPEFGYETGAYDPYLQQAYVINQKKSDTVAWVGISLVILVALIIFIIDILVFLQLGAKISVF